MAGKPMIQSLFRGLAAGAAAGAAGTTALNAVTYLDMVLRARAASSTPEQTVRAIAGRAHIRIPGDDEARRNRIAGLGPLTGIAAGVGVGVLLGITRTAGWRSGPLPGSLTATALALTAGNAPMTALKVTDPRTWSGADWISDIVPHLAYGAVTDAILRALERNR